MDHHEDECRMEGESTNKQDDEEAVARLEELKKSIEAKMALRQSNLNPERPDAGFLRTLDSSIKRNTAVIKKLKQINEELRDALMDELRGVNLSKFVSEAVAAICEAKLRSSDIQAAVQICSLLHQRYKDFVPSLIQGLLKVFSPGKPGDEPDADKNLKAMKKRSSLKLLLELYFVGVIEDGGIFINIIKDLTSVEQLKDRDATQTSLTLLSCFARQGRIFMGLPVTGPEIHEEFFKGLSITADQKKVIRKVCYSFYDTAAEILQSEHSSLRLMEHENSKILNAKGELSDENTASYEKLRKSYDQLYRNVSSLAEALDMQPPVMPEDGHTTRVTSGEEGISSGTGKDSSVVEPIWDDEDTRAFYECLPDLRAFVPAVLLGETEPKVSEQSVKSQDQPTMSEVPSEDHDYSSNSEYMHTPVSSEDEGSYPLNSEYIHTAAFGHVQLELGIEFANLTLFKNAVRDFNISLGRDIKWKKNDKKRARAVCANEECKWVVLCSWESKLHTFQIKTFNDVHTCTRTFQNKCANKRWVAKRLEDRLATQPNIKKKQAMALMKEDFLLHLEHKKVSRALKIAREAVEGSEKKQYGQLWDYLEEVHKTNPGSTAVMEDMMLCGGSDAEQKTNLVSLIYSLNKHRKQHRS